MKLQKMLNEISQLQSVLQQRQEENELKHNDLMVALNNHDSRMSYLETELEQTKIQNIALTQVCSLLYEELLVYTNPRELIEKEFGFNFGDDGLDIDFGSEDDEDEFDLDNDEELW